MNGALKRKKNPWEWGYGFFQNKTFSKDPGQPQKFLMPLKLLVLSFVVSR